MVNLVNVEVSLSAKQWPGNNNTNRTNYSGGAELKFALGFDESEVVLSMENFEEDLKKVIDDIVGTSFKCAEAEVMAARDVMVLPVMPTIPAPTVDGQDVEDVTETPKDNNTGQKKPNPLKQHRKESV